MTSVRPYLLISCVALFAVCHVSTALADETRGQDAQRLLEPSYRQPLSLAQAEPAPARTETRTETTEKTTSSSPLLHQYREVSDFFNIREANPQVEKCELEFETTGLWLTKSNHHRDQYGIAESIKYGITDDFFVEIENAQPRFGQGGDQGNGETFFTLFNRFVRETDCMPAIAGQAEMRIPTGDGSKGVDATFSGILTKTIIEKFRVHLEGYIETANGHWGEKGEGQRRSFQWGVGPGFDYLIDERTLVLLNYLNQSSDERGEHNNNILELGFSREICQKGDVHQHLKGGLDIGLDGQAETPHLGAKLLWSISWK
jgi:hypothetical protein